MPAATPEEELLIPRSNDEDLWAEYELSSVHVHAPDSESPNAPVSLLHASIGNPLVVTGQLEPLDPSDFDHLVPGAKLTNKRINLELTDVCTFSYGELGDGSVAVWAAGKSGWFKIKPGRAYRPMFEEMQEAVKLLYFVSDSYKETRKERGGGRGKKAMILPPYSALELAGKYAVEMIGTEDADEGFDKFEEHREFLIASMLAGKEGLDWATFPLWTDMLEKFPDVFKKMRKRLNAKPAKLQAKMPAVTDSASTKSSRENPGRQRKHEKGSTASRSTTAVRKKQGRPENASGAVDVIYLSGSESSEEVKDTLVQAASDEPEGSLEAKGKLKAGLSRRTRYNDVESTPLQTISREDDSDDDAQIRNKSSLRPRASKGNKGGKGRARSREAEEQNTTSSPTQGGKRKNAQEDSRRPHKRRSSDSPDLENEQAEEDADDDEGIDIPASPEDIPDNPDPVQENTWVCALAGCTHKVFLSHLPTSQKLIREHYALHAYDDDERVRMVKRLAQPSLPIGHLMEKVRGQARMEGFPNSTVAVSRFDGGVVQRF